MNSSLLKSVMVKNDDTQRQLAEAMGLSLSTLNAKINGKVEFRQGEIDNLRSRYCLTGEEVLAIFFAS